MKKTGCRLARNYVLCILLFICLKPGPALGQGNATIKPGEGVGVLRLGSVADEIASRIGARTQPSREAVGETTFSRTYDNLGMVLYFDKTTRQLERIVVLNPRLLVDGSGIRVGDSLLKVERYYGKSTNRTPYDYENLGIRFWSDPKTKKISAIEVKRIKK